MAEQSESTYFIHSAEESWQPEDLRQIRDMLESFNFSESTEAAIGEGAGGPGWETIIELVLTASATGSLTEQLWRVVKFLKSKTPKAKSPNGKEIYRAVFHTNYGRIAVDLTSPIEDLDIAINEKLTMKIENGELHVFDQNGRDWDGY